MKSKGGRFLRCEGVLSGVLALSCVLEIGVAEVTVPSNAKDEAIREWRSFEERSGGYRPAFDRRGAFSNVLVHLNSGTLMTEVRGLLGEPGSSMSYQGGTIWTYVLGRGDLGQIVFDAAGKIRSTVGVVCRVSRHPERDEWTLSGTLPTGGERQAYAGMWRAYSAVPDGWWEDKYEIAERVREYIRPGMSRDDVVTLLGSPMSQRGFSSGTISTYLVMGQSSFLQVWYDKTVHVMRTTMMTYQWSTGDTQPSPDDAGLGPDDTQAADVAAWKATNAADRGQICRRGIGKRMETYLKVGMTKADVEALMGEPESLGTGGLRWRYTLHTDSVIKVIFDEGGKLKEVIHVGT